MATNAHPRFGIREVCHCVFTSENPAKSPSFVIDTAKMSSIESSSTTVYAQGGSGNARLIGWEGEKTMTFTVEDALITKESFAALTGAEWNTQGIFKIKSTSFAGNYRVSAYTLWRKEDGNDYLVELFFPKVKLQTQLNLSMGPTGDPAAFTFTFDAFPDLNNDGLMLEFKLNEEEGPYNDNLADETSWPNDGETTVIIDGVEYTTTAQTPILSVNAAGAVELTDCSALNDALVGLNSDGVLTDLKTTDLRPEESVQLRTGSTTRWYTV